MSIERRAELESLQAQIAAARKALAELPARVAQQTRTTNAAEARLEEVAGPLREVLQTNRMLERQIEHEKGGPNAFGIIVAIAFVAVMIGSCVVGRCGQ